MRNLKRFNEILENEPHKSVDIQRNQMATSTEGDDVMKFQEFSENRLQGASKIAGNAEEKGGDALLTYYHFQVKLPYYRQAAEGKFNPKLAKAHYRDLVEELYQKIAMDGSPNIEQIKFQELLGKIEVVGELLIKEKSL